MRFAKNEDLNGYVRGAHQDGVEICDGFEFHMPGSGYGDKVVWGWNDVKSFNCEKCKRPATEHIVLRAPKAIETKGKGMDDLPAGAVTTVQKGRANATRAAPPDFDPTSADPTAMSEKRRQREAETAAFFNAGYSPDGMLDEANDPLAVAARPKPKPPPAKW